MIIYNVTIKIVPEIEAAWIAWMKEVHIPDLMQTGLFTGHRLCRLLEHEETDGITFIAQYFCNSFKEYKNYIAQHAPSMREKGLQKFGNKFIPFRTVMEEV